PHIGLSATTLSAGAATGSVVSQTVELANDSPGTLEWSAPPPDLQFGATQAMVQAEPDAPAIKGVDGPSSGQQTEGAGGPDASGSRWSASSEPDGPVYQWVDIVQPANAIALSGDEAVSAQLPLGFSFPYYGHRYTQVRVCTNGYLEFSNDGPL